MAGRWYPDDPDRLRADLDRYLGDAVCESLSPPRAIIVPHAGLMYSGPVAAYGFAAVQRPVASVVLVGPSHYVSFEGVSLWPDGGWETPFGPVAVDAGLASAVASETDLVVELAAAHRREHSLEMELPFIAHRWPGASVVPLVMGGQTRKTSFELGAAIARAVAAQPRDVLLVASSDLSHYEPADTASRLDGMVLARVEAFDPDGLMSLLEREPGHACGGGPMVAVLEAAKRLGARSARVLRYADSGDVSGDKSAVVGYMAAAMC